MPENTNSMPNLPAEGLFTYEFTNETIVIYQNYNIKQLSVRCLATSAASGTVKGTGTAGPYQSKAMTVEQGAAQTLWTYGAQPAGNVTIVAPANCTMQIWGVRN